LTSLHLKYSVGSAGRNKPVDVTLTQYLLKTYFTKIIPVKGSSSMPQSPSLQIDGECSPDLIRLIKDFQAEAIGSKNPDGRIDPHGRTFQKLTSVPKYTGASPKTVLFGPAPGNTGILTKVDSKRFRKLFGQQLSLPAKGEYLLGFFGFLQEDKDVDDVRWAAYMLATAFRETDSTFLPVEEKGKGAGHPYGVGEEVIDVQGYRGVKNAKYKNVYYGRGYCQITHKGTYQTMSKALGLGDELCINPTRTLEKKISYDIMSNGMRRGLFTTLKLSDYINDKKCDYKNARKIINGTDHDTDIAGYAADIEVLLRLCAGTVAIF
jgi:hypothetical protein